LVFLILLVTAWGIVVLPRAREHHWSRPTVSTRRYRTSMKMVAPLSESEVRRANARRDEPQRRARERRRDVIAFLATGAISAALSALLSESWLAWPICAAFSAILLGYLGAILEADRRRVQRRMAARRAARLAAEKATEPELAEAV
jgi:peptidoglycan/LPS O-acetylase OafA/YrhL